VLTDGQFYTWFNLNPTGDSSYSDINWSEWWFLSQWGKINPTLFFEVQLCARLSGVAQHATCFSSSDCGVTKINEFSEPSEESGYLELWKVMMMHIVTDVGSELPQMCTKFTRGPSQFDENVSQINFFSYKFLFCDVHKQLLWWNMYLETLPQNKINCWRLHSLQRVVGD